MSSQVNPNNINAQYPVPGVNQSSQGFRSNFLAIQQAFAQYVVEMNDVINKAIVSAPLIYGANSSINNFGGMQNSNLLLLDFGYVTSNITASSANSVPTLNFSNTAVANIQITATSPVTQTINISNFPNIGYSEIMLQVYPNHPPQFLNFSAITPGAVVMNAGTIANYDTGNANLTLGSSAAHFIRLGSSDGVNWNLDKISFARARQSSPPTSVGAAGDVIGDIACASGFIYVCIANYDGVNEIWQRAALTTF